VANRQRAAKRRRWADVVVIVAALYVFLAAIWSPPAIGPGEAAGAVEHGLWWWAHAIGGFLALLSIPLAQKQPMAGKVLAGVAALVMLAGVFVTDGGSWLTLRALGIPGLAVLLAAPFVGPMPSPQEEGHTGGSPLDPRKDVRARPPGER
jgi:hypothetical protein